MQIPDVLTIVGIDYKVCFNDGAIHTVDEDGQKIKHETVANVDFLNCRINISDTLSDQITDLSFIHEVVHAILFAMGYQMEMSTMNNDEQFVEGFAQIMLQVMNQILEYNLLYEDYFEDLDEEEIVDTKKHWYLEYPTNRIKGENIC